MRKLLGTFKPSGLYFIGRSVVLVRSLKLGHIVALPEGRFDSALARSETDRQNGWMKLRILSLNAGLLKLFGRSVPVPFVEERGAALPAELRKTECDIVLLQEVYEHSTRQWLAESLQDIYPLRSIPGKSETSDWRMD